MLSIKHIVRSFINILITSKIESKTTGTTKTLFYSSHYCTHMSTNSMDVLLWVALITKKASLLEALIFYF